jgi:hypothetical protein
MPAGCADVGALGASAQALTEIDPLQDGLDAPEAALAHTKAAVGTALMAGSAELQPAVKQTHTAFAAVQAASDGVTAETLSEHAPAIASALLGLKASLAPLSATLTQECPKP